jgi:hypothetical protein
MDRYVERVVSQGKSVRGELLAAAQRADALQERTDAGDRMWIDRVTGVIFVVKTDGDERVVVTCLSAREHQQWGERRQQEVLDAAQLLPPLEQPSETIRQQRETIQRLGERKRRPGPRSLSPPGRGGAPAQGRAGPAGGAWRTRRAVPGARHRDRRMTPWQTP